MAGRVPRVTKTEALALRHRRLGETDRIVTFLTPGRGKIDAVAKGALRPRSKLAGHVEPLTRCEVVLAHGRTLDIITQAQMIDGFPALRSDLDRLSTAMYVLELTDRFTVDQSEGEDVYRLLLDTLTRLERGDGSHFATRYFELALLELTGFRPEWDACTSCNTTVDARIAVWSPIAGGVLCADCRGGYADAAPIPDRVLRVLRAIQQRPYEAGARIRITPELAAGLERVMHELMRVISERDLASARFVTAVRAADARAKRGYTDSAERKV